MKRVIENPTTAIIQQQVKSKEIKVLLNSECEKQELITFSLPEEDFTVQDLLELLNAELNNYYEFKTVVSFVNDETSGINYIIDLIEDVSEETDSKNSWKDSSINYGESRITIDENSNYVTSQSEVVVAENWEQDSKLNLNIRRKRHSPDKTSRGLENLIWISSEEESEKEESIKIPSSSVNSSRVNLSCSTIRIGSYKCESKELVTVSKDGLQLVVPSLKDDNKFVKLDIKHRHIVKVQCHFGERKSILFFKTSSNTVENIRESLGMDDPKGPYFSPKSRECAHRKITLDVGVISLECKLIINELFKADLEILTLQRANEILINISHLDPPLPVFSREKHSQSATSLKKSDSVSTSPEKESYSSIADIDYDLSESHSLLKTVVQNPETTIVQQQIKGNQVKMLIILLTGEQRLITFNIPAANCTVQDLLDQIIYHFGSNKVVTLMSNPTSGVNYYLVQFQSEDLIYISSNEEWEEETKFMQVKLSCRVVRIGSYKFKPEESVVVSEDGLRLTVPSIEDNKVVTLNINSEKIVRVLSHFGKWSSIFFVHTSKETGAMIREVLGMKDPRGPYYDPASEDLTQKRITLLSRVVTLEAQEILTNNLFGKKIEELNQKEANEIFVAAFPQNFSLRSFPGSESSHSEDYSYVHKSATRKPKRGRGSRKLRRLLHKKKP